MKLEILNDLSQLLDNDNLTIKLSYIDKLIELKRYKDAYFKLAVFLEYINVVFINKVLNIDLENSSVINICNIYLKYDSNLSRKMVAINGEYNLVCEDVSLIDIDDVEILAGNIYSIYEYIIKNYGKFM